MGPDRKVELESGKKTSENEQEESRLREEQTKESNCNSDTVREQGHRERNIEKTTGVFFAWAWATAEQAICMEAYNRVCLHQNGASQIVIEIILLVGLGECARDLTKWVPWVPEDIFSYRYWWFVVKRRRRGAKCRGERAFNINRYQALFISS